MGWNVGRDSKTLPPSGIGWGNGGQTAARQPCPSCQATDGVHWQTGSCGHQTFHCGECGHSGCAIPTCHGYFQK